MQFHAAPAFSHSPAASPASLLLGSAQRSKVFGGKQPYNFMQDLVQTGSQLLSILCQGNCPQNVANAPQNKQPVRQAPCVPRPELFCERDGSCVDSQAGEIVLSAGSFSERAINSENRWGQRSPCILILFCHL